MKEKRLLNVALQVTIISGLFLLLYLICLSSHAEQIRYPVPCYEGEELDKVRQWEKKWVGEKINSMNIHKVKEFVPESLFCVIIHWSNFLASFKVLFVF